MRNFVLKGNLIFSTDAASLHFMKHAYVVCADGICQGTFYELPSEYLDFPIIDYSDSIIIPGLIDLHTHAPQYPFRGIGMDMELLDWLNSYTFPEEGKYSGLIYAEQAYSQFVEKLVKSATTRACIFATVHYSASMLLMDMLDIVGMRGYVGKVSMDRNAPDFLIEEHAAAEELSWLNRVYGRSKRIKPIITPRFIPSCSDALMKELAQMQKDYRLPAQSHLSENPDEIKWVQELVPESSCYGDAYDRVGLFGSNGPVVMAHCVHSTDEEISLLKQRGVFVAHCPLSNTNLASGIAPAKRYLQENISIGLGTDIAAGYDYSIFSAMAEAIKVSKLRWRLTDSTYSPLTLEEAFFMGTKGGGAFFGKVGSFEPGFEFDAVVMDDSSLHTPMEAGLRERLERLIYLASDDMIQDKYIAGEKINRDFFNEVS